MLAGSGDDLERGVRFAALGEVEQAPREVGHRLVDAEAVQVDEGARRAVVPEVEDDLGRSGVQRRDLGLELLGAAGELVRGLFVARVPGMLRTPLELAALV